MVYSLTSSVWASVSPHASLRDLDKHFKQRRKQNIFIISLLLHMSSASQPNYGFERVLHSAHLPHTHQLVWLLLLPDLLRLPLPRQVTAFVWSPVDLSPCLFVYFSQSYLTPQQNLIVSLPIILDTFPLECCDALLFSGLFLLLWLLIFILHCGSKPSACFLNVNVPTHVCSYPLSYCIHSDDLILIRATCSCRLCVEDSQLYTLSLVLTIVL